MPVLLFIFLIVLLSAISVSVLCPSNEKLKDAHEEYQRRLATKRGRIASLAKLVDHIAYAISLNRWRLIGILSLLWFLILLFWLLII